MFTIVAISGNKHSGKDTFGNMLVDELVRLEIPAKRFGFADKIKEYATKYFGWDGKKDEKGRKLLKGFGNEFVIEVLKDEKFWINHCYQDMRAWFSQHGHVEGTACAVITDMRFVREIRHLSIYGPPVDYDADQYSLFLMMQRSGHTGGGDEHPSESEQHSEEFTKYIHDYVPNNSSLEALQAEAFKLAHSIKETDDERQTNDE